MSLLLESLARYSSIQPLKHPRVCSLRVEKHLCPLERAKRKLRRAVKPLALGGSISLGVVVIPPAFGGALALGVVVNPQRLEELWPWGWW